MSTGSPAQPRGRPRTITRERLADAGIEMGLPHITIVGMAALLGVSHMALYKRIRNLEELKRLVAEETFERWQLPAMPGPGRESLEAYLEIFSRSMWTLICRHPGLAPYLLRLDKITPAMMTKIDGHQTALARATGLSKAQSKWLLFTVAYHCVAVADTIQPEGRKPEAGRTRAVGTDGPIDAEYALGIRALIKGALATLAEVKAG